MSHENNEDCIGVCNACADACDHCAIACLQEPDVQRMTTCIALDIDCAVMCRVAAGYMARGSRVSASVCRACADICQACGDECVRSDMAHCQRCAEACRLCAEACRAMAASETA